jgi:queuosine precursor transporter
MSPAAEKLMSLSETDSPTAVHQSAGEEKLFTYVSCVYVGMIVASFAGASKVAALGWGFKASVTVISFMIAQKLIDFLNEIGHRERAAALINPTLLASVVAALIFYLSVHAPPDPHWNDLLGKRTKSVVHSQDGYEQVLGATWRLLLGGNIAFYVSTRLRLPIYRYLQYATSARESLAWLRTLLTDQTVYLVDTALFVCISFWDVPGLFRFFVGQHATKVFLSFVLSGLFQLVITTYRKRSAAVA